MSVKVFYQNYEKAPYLSYDSVLNPYNYKDLQHRYPTYLDYQKLFYETKQHNELQDIEYNITKKDPSNIPVDVRSTIYKAGEADNNEKLNLFRRIDNNSNFWYTKNNCGSNFYSIHEYNPLIGMSHPLPKGENIYEAAIKSSITYRGM